jgi:tetratricopeptide (TPR) repeat protein
MAIVALAAAAVGGWVLRGRSVTFQKKATGYAVQARQCRNQAQWLRSSAQSPAAMLDVVGKPNTFLTNQIAALEKMARDNALDADHFERLHAKYASAAGRPWFSVSPDPPPPSLWHRPSGWLARRDLGDYDAAIADCEELLRWNPDHPGLLNALAWIYATCPEPGCRNGSKSLAYAERVCALAGPGQPDLLDTLAAACAETGDFARARCCMRAALEHTVANSPVFRAYHERLAAYRDQRPYRDHGSILKTDRW